MGKGLIIVAVVIAVALIGLLAINSGLISIQLNNPLSNKPQVDMRQLLKNEVAGTYSISDTDWSVWSKIFKDSGGILTRMDTWEQFKAAYKQSVSRIVIMLDVDDRVVWFKGAMNQAVYYQY